MTIQRCLNGVVASGGHADGRPVVVLSPQDLNTVQHGDILVAVETDISFVPAMHRASAIITETGGRFCHAAVWARENRKPAVIQVQTATQSLQSVEFIIVEAHLGMVKWEESNEPKG